eukprot:CAMPEP_0119377946 /NCGR_PEP_ID=MMETSP1334-20130426/47308_1 /TAXON_ID=127549 /ORGANISM="Calcidiscus leptoporus, Strain RCC1130" /LENGTH=58 /DNA_ID=CAMNT_0007397023 /DNA_START=115 /DNA_END=288 /DNA_ORIENTATION=-
MTARAKDTYLTDAKRVSWRQPSHRAYVATCEATVRAHFELTSVAEANHYQAVLRQSDS